MQSEIYHIICIPTVTTRFFPASQSSDFRNQPSSTNKPPCAHVRGVENDAAIVGADHCPLASVHAEIGAGDQTLLVTAGATGCRRGDAGRRWRRRRVHPVGHLLVGDVPQAQFAVHRAGQEVAVVLRMEHDCRHEVRVAAMHYRPALGEYRHTADIIY